MTPQSEIPMKAVAYEIRIQGYLDPFWSEWLDGLSVTPQDNGETLLSGCIPDQAALHGVLAKIRDLNLVLILVRRASH